MFCSGYIILRIQRLEGKRCRSRWGGCLQILLFSSLARKVFTYCKITHCCFIAVFIRHDVIVIQKELNIWIKSMYITEHFLCGVWVSRVAFVEISMQIFIVNVPVFEPTQKLKFIKVVICGKYINLNKITQI